MILINHEFNDIFSLSVEFLLDSASSYNPTTSLFQEAPGSERIVVHGFDRICKALFTVYARLAEGEQVIVEGTSDQTVSSGIVLIIDS